MQTIGSDLRYALRQLRRSPVFMLSAILTLALGVGANTAIFSLLDQALLRALPVRDPGSLVYLQGTGDAWNGHMSTHGGGVESYFSYPMYRDLRDKNAAFEDLAGTVKTSVGLRRGEISEIGEVELVSGNYFTMLGVRPALGRTFTQAEDVKPDGNPVAVMSYSYWQGHMNGDPSVVNQTMLVNGQPFLVVGVSAPGFRSAVWGETPALFVPMSMIGELIPGQSRRLTDHTDRWMNILGRLKPGVSTKQAEAMSAPLWHALRADELKALGGTHSKHFVDGFLTNSRLLVQHAARGFSYNRENYERPLRLVMAMALLVLLVAGINVAGLLLVRSSARMAEFSLRYALGARAGRIVQQLLLEGLLIGVGGGAVGILLAPAVIRVLVKQLGGPFDTAVDARLLGFNFAVAIVVSVLFSLAPVTQLLRPEVFQAMRTQAATGSGGMLVFRRFVVGTQIALSLLLLVGAGLFVRTMQQLRTFDLGYKTDHLVGFGLAPKLAGYDDLRIEALQRRMVDDLSAIPGVESAGVTNTPQLAGQTHGGNVSFASYKAAPEEDMDVEKSNISPGFFRMLGAPLLSGRAFTAEDDATHPKVAIVNEALAKKFFGSATKAVGQRMMDGASNKPNFDIEIVGVAGDFRVRGVRDPVLPTVFQPMEQMPDSNANRHADRELFFYVRTRLPEAEVFGPIRRAVLAADPKLVIDDLRTMEGQIDLDLANERMIELLAVSFGVLATVLAGVGLYGVVAYTTGRRTREIGIRMALGSSREAIAQMVYRDVLVLVGLGLAVGIPVAIMLGRLLRSQLFGISPTDPVAFLIAIAVVGGVALVAAALPARKAAQVEPSEVLRSE
jgi:putative ABC transport system permease protein